MAQFDDTTNDTIDNIERLTTLKEILEAEIITMTNLINTVSWYRAKRDVLKADRARLIALINKLSATLPKVENPL